jgi:hypothetical protein
MDVCRRTAAAATVVVAMTLAACSVNGATSATGVSASSAPTVRTGAQVWKEDLDALLTGIETTHPNPWWRESRADFVSRLTQLGATAPGMSKTAQELAVMELVATIDGHSGVYPTDLGWHYYGIEFYEFAEGTFVLAADGQPEAVGARLVSVGGMPLAEVYRRITASVSRDNQWSLISGRPLSLVMPEVLATKGVVSSAAAPAYVVEKPDGSRLTLNPTALTWEGYQARLGWYPVLMPPRVGVLAQQRIKDPMWSTDLGGGVLYVQMNAVVSAGLPELVETITAALRRPGFRRLIVDIRYNGGGDNHTYRPLLAVLGDARLARHLVLVTGRETFSAATNFATEVDALTSAVIVGEPTGGRPNLYGDVRDVRLPNSGIIAHISSRFWQFGGPGDVRDAVLPDVAIPVRASDYFAARDPALTAALTTKLD